MPLLDIATAKSYFQANILPPGARTLLNNNFVFGNDKSFAYRWNLFQIPKNKNNFYTAHVVTQRSVLQIRAVATLEPKCSVQINGEKNSEQNHWQSIDSKATLEKEEEYSGYESEEVDEREKLRRMRISKANSGKTPWNKGRKHSAETKRRIKERTRIAMQSPKVKMKLANMGHAQSKETRIRIGVSVRTTWEKRREKLMVQERCHFEWQNLIAEASRKGLSKEEEVQWNSYEIMDEELEQEFLNSVEQRKTMPRAKGNRRAPKSAEQKRKIAASVAAKWADPAYRDRVRSALSKYYDSPERAERQPRRRATNENPRPPRAPSLTKKKESSKPPKIVNRTRLRKRKVPIYKDPLASSKLEMIKNIRAQRESAGNKKSQAIEQAKLLIAEAEKAAKALEEAALTNPIALASLAETRNLIAEAIQSIQSIEMLQTDSQANDQVQTNDLNTNGTLLVESLESNTKELVNGKTQDLSTSFGLNGCNILPGLNGYTKTNETSFEGEKLSHVQINGHSKHEKAVLVPNGAHLEFEKREMNPKPNAGSKKWICGRLVEVVEGDTISV